jgi:hypothetical protein
VAGLLSPTGWIEGLVFLATGAMWGPQNKIASMLWNYGDNVAFVVFEDDSTWGMFKAFYCAAHGDYSQFSMFSSVHYLYYFLQGG